MHNNKDSKNRSLFAVLFCSYCHQNYGNETTSERNTITQKNKILLYFFYYKHVKIQYYYNTPKYIL